MTLRVLFFCGILSAPWLLLGWLFEGIEGLIASGILCLAALYSSYLLSPKLLVRYFHAKSLSQDHPVSRTFRLLRVWPPSVSLNLMVYPDPWPNAFVAKASGSWIFLSSGLLQASSEVELKAILIECASAFKVPGVGAMTWSTAGYCTLKRLRVSPVRSPLLNGALQTGLWLVRAPFYALFSYLRGADELFPPRGRVDLKGHWSIEPGFTRAALSAQRDLYPLSRWSDPGIRELLRI